MREGAPHLVLDAGLEHRGGARGDAPLELLRRAARGRRSASDGGCRRVQSRSCSGASERPAAASSRARTTRRRSLGWTAAAASGSRLGKERVRALGALGVVEGFPAVPLARRRAPEEDRARRAPRAGRGPFRRRRSGVLPRSRISSIAACARRLVLADGCFVVEVPDPDQPRRPFGLVGQERQPAVDLHRVGGDDLGWDPLGDAPRRPPSCPKRSARRSRGRSSA